MVITVFMGDKLGLFSRLVGLFKINKSTNIVEKLKKETKTEDSAVFYSSSKNIDSYTNIWHYIKPKENTQAYHVLGVIKSEEWIDMDEVRKRIKDLFFIEYQHEKSLYPYIKTLVDIGLLETNSVGGKRKWKKKELIIKTPLYLSDLQK